MLPLLFILLLAIPVLELWIIVQVAGELGLPLTLVSLIAISMAGAWLLKQQGMATWRRLQTTIRSGGVPTQEVTDGGLILMGGAFLLTPGFLTDAVGIILLLPPTRATIKAAARRWWAARARRKLSGTAPRGPGPTGAARDWSTRGRSSLFPPESGRPGEDDSPDRG